MARKPKVYLVVPIKHRRSVKPKISTVLKAALVAGILGAHGATAKPTDRLSPSQLKNLMDPRVRAKYHERMNAYATKNPYAGMEHGSLSNIYSRPSRILSNKLIQETMSKHITPTLQNYIEMQQRNAKTQSLLDTNKTMLRTVEIDHAAREYALTRHSGNLCRSANVFVNDPMVPKEGFFYGGSNLAFLLDADISIREGRVHGVGLTDVLSPSDPLRHRCGVPPKFAKNRTTWNAAAKASKYSFQTWSPHAAMGNCEVNVDVTDSQILGLVVYSSIWNRGTPPYSWNEIQSLVYQSRQIAAAYGTGPSRLTNVYCVDPKTNMLTKVTSAAQYAKMFDVESFAQTETKLARSSYKLLHRYGLRPGMKKKEIHRLYASDRFHYLKQWKSLPTNMQKAYDLAYSMSLEKVGFYNGNYS